MDFKPVIQKRLTFTLLLFMACLIPFVGTAQNKKWNPFDTIQLNFAKKGGFRLGLDGSTSFIFGNPARVFGARFGFDYGKVAAFTGAYSALAYKIQDKDTLSGGFNFVATTLEYYIHQSWRFEVAIPVQLGFGYTYITSSQNGNRNRNGAFFPLSTGIQASVRFLRYFGVSAGIGARIGILQSKDFTAPYFFAGLTYYTGTMYRDFKRLKKGEKINFRNPG